MVGICTGLALGSGSNPLTVVTVRSIGAIVLLLGYLRLAGVRIALSPRDRALALAIGLLLALNNWLINAAMADIPVPLAVLLFYLWPAITSAAAWLLGRERFRGRTLTGLALAFAGIALALNVEFSAAQLRGVLYALGSAFTWSAVFLLVDHHFRGRDMRQVTLYMMYTAAVVFVALCVITREIVAPGTPAGWAGIAGVPFFYAFGLIGLFVVTAALGPGRTGFYMNFEPIAAVALAAPILGQKLAPVQLAGAALVVAALCLFRPPR
jgi:drug/metabolite transporter (DMT)-like permease